MPPNESPQTVKPIAVNLRETEVLERAGFRPGAPPHVQGIGLPIDRAILRGMACPECEGRGMEARTFHRGHRYRVLAVCQQCGHTEEF